MSIALQVENLFVSYHGNNVLHDINFSTEKGKLIGIIGPNGAGKSTLMKAVLGLIRKDNGNVKILGKTIKEVQKKIAYVPQRNHIDWDFPIIVIDTVLIGTYPTLGIFHRPKKAERAWSYECLKKVGMEEFSNRQIGELSGGQQQRIFLARALAQRAEMFFLDEPFVGVDMASEEMIIKILKELRDEGKTVFVVHHDLSTVTDYFDELLLINKEMIEYGAVEKVFHPECMSKAYKAQYAFMKEIGVPVS